MKHDPPERAREPTRLVVTDLDNTLYDWAESFVEPLYALAQRAAAALGVQPGRVLDELRAVHRLHGDVEHPQALLSTRSVRARLWTASTDNQRLVAHLERAQRQFEAAQAGRLQLYPGVATTLAQLAERGVRIAAVTDATLPNAERRVQQLGLDRYLHALYAAAPMHRVPGLPEPRHPQLFVQTLGPQLRKPMPELLWRICRDQGVPEAHTLYVGDSLGRDVAMARSAGVRHAWAHYGTALSRPLRRKLARVSHYSRADVERERRARRLSLLRSPEVTLRDGLHELWTHFEFPHGPNRPQAQAPTRLGEPRAQPQLARAGSTHPRTPC